jgi:hypothetical protein
MENAKKKKKVQLQCGQCTQIRATNCRSNCCKTCCTDVKCPAHAPKPAAAARASVAAAKPKHLFCTRCGNPASKACITAMCKLCCTDLGCHAHTVKAARAQAKPTSPAPPKATAKKEATKQPTAGAAKAVRAPANPNPKPTSPAPPKATAKKETTKQPTAGTSTLAVDLASQLQAAQKITQSKGREEKSQVATASYAQTTAALQAKEDMRLRTVVQCPRPNCGIRFAPQHNTDSSCTFQVTATDFVHSGTWRMRFFTKNTWSCCGQTTQSVRGCELKTVATERHGPHLEPSAAVAAAAPSLSLAFTVNLGGRPYLIDLAAMTQTNQKTGFVRALRLRQATGVWEYEDNAAGSGNWQPYDAKTALVLEHHALTRAGTGQLALPIHWSPFLRDSKAEVFAVLEGQERRSVTDRFLRTMPPQTSVVLVERVQNMRLWYQFQAWKQGKDDIRKLFHGTTADTAEKIVASDIGFDRSYAGKNASAFGNGVYFARDARYSSQVKYSTPDDRGVQRMFLCQVVVGKFCKGTPGANRPHLPGSATDCYDTTVDNQADPSIFVTYRDGQMYPEYIIHFVQS